MCKNNGTKYVYTEGKSNFMLATIVGRVTPMKYYHDDTIISDFPVKCEISSATYVEYEISFLVKNYNSCNRCEIIKNLTILLKTGKKNAFFVSQKPEQYYPEDKEMCLVDCGRVILRPNDEFYNETGIKLYGTEKISEEIKIILSDPNYQMLLQFEHFIENDAKHIEWKTITLSVPK